MFPQEEDVERENAESDKPATPSDGLDLVGEDLR